MIDLQELIKIKDVPRLLPASPRTGRPFTRNAVYFWIASGIGGHRLETVKVGGSMFTSAEAVERFIRRVTEQHARDVAEAVPA